MPVSLPRLLPRALRRAVVLSLSGLVLALPLSAETAIRAVTLSTAGLAMIEAGEPNDAAWISAGTWTVEIVDREWPCTVSLRPLFDPANEKIKR